MAVLAVLLAAIALAMAARSLTYTAWYQHWRYARMSLERLAVEAQRHSGNSIVLYYYGKALDAQGRFAEALVPLEQASGLDPDDAQLRGEWASAQMAGGYITGAFGQLTQFVRTHPDSALGHLFLGRFYVAQSSYVRATEELEQAVRLDPNQGEAWSLLAGARLQMGGFVLARDAARKAVSLRPKSAVDHMLLASLLLATNDREGAKQEYATASTLSPRDPGYLCEYARILLKGGDTNEIAQAEQLARRALALNPQAADANYDLGRALALEGKFAEAIPPLEIAASTIPPERPHSALEANAADRFLDPMPAMELARAYRKAGDEAKAKVWEQQYLVRQQGVEEERTLSDAVRNHPEDKDVRRRMALFLARRGDVEGVARNFAKILNGAEDAPRVLVETANALAAAGYGDLAVPLAKRATVFSKNNPAAYEAYGNGLLAMGQAHEAAVKYAKAAAWWPEKRPQYEHYIADFYRQRKQNPSEAERCYQEAIALERERMGLAFNIDKVKVLLERAVALDPKNTDYRRYLLRALMNRHEKGEAEQAARQLLALSPEDGLSHAMLAILLLDKASSDQALAEIDTHLNAAEEEAGILPTVHYGQGVLALRRHQATEAVRLLRLSAQEDPADLTYYQLAQAERMAGNTSEAEKILALLATRTDQNRQAIALMQRISEQPTDRQRYVDALRFYAQHGMKAQADAIETEMLRRFGVDRS